MVILEILILMFYDICSGDQVLNPGDGGLRAWLNLISQIELILVIRILFIVVLMKCCVRQIE
jgi:hypothetical protein